MCNILDKKLHDVMSTPVITITADTSLLEAADILSKSDIRGVPVVNEQSVVGVLSMTDIVKTLAMDEVAAASIDPREGDFLEILRRLLATEAISVGNIMSPVPIRLPATATLRDACRAMDEHDIRRILVDQGKELVGIVTAMDIVRYVASE